MNTENAISVKNLTKQYDGFKLDNVSFQIPMGTIVGFVGENGAGKSTTIRAALGLIPIEEGEENRKSNSQSLVILQDWGLFF